MYTPANFKITDTSEAVAFMQRYSFATLISVSSGLPVATHLPFVVQEKYGKIYLSSHLAKANPQSTDLLNKTALVIFSEPHAYVSPKHYEKELNVPTWNYLAVHAYGKTIITHGEDAEMDALERMINYYDQEYSQQWAGLPYDYKSKLCKAITIFEIEVTDLQGKKKLSQNRSETDRQNIIVAFTNSADYNERVIAEYMHKE